MIRKQLFQLRLDRPLILCISLSCRRDGIRTRDPIFAAGTVNLRPSDPKSIAW